MPRKVWFNTLRQRQRRATGSLSRKFPKSVGCRLAVGGPASISGADWVVRPEFFLRLISIFYNNYGGLRAK
jgi:hypothetical protein